jgi:hypothetical protein
LSTSWVAQSKYEKSKYCANSHLDLSPFAIFFFLINFWIIFLFWCITIGTTMVLGCWASRRSRKRWKPVIVRSPSPDCRCSCHYGNRTTKITFASPVRDCESNRLSPPHKSIEIKSFATHEPLRLTPFPSNSYRFDPNSTKSFYSDKRSIRTINSLKESSSSPPFVMDITYVTERIIGMIFKLSRQLFLFYIK